MGITPNGEKGEIIMKTKNMILTALFLAIGFILHSSVPGIFGMKFDLFLAFMFLSIVIYPTLQNALLAGTVGGMITALTTTFPGGQLPNFIDKIVTAIFVYLLIKALAPVSNYKIKMALIGLIGTAVSGTVFLGSALFIVGLPAPFMVLFTTIVIPTSLTNMVITLIVYKACMVATKGKLVFSYIYQ